ncbi:hypothetical protein HZC21_06420 [Candidatus Peregrinibacteria bacterium]|nr:hypothetical protein [Candidatus Peregrinibacteria bacterium]
MENNKHYAPLSFSHIYQNLKDCAISIQEIFTQNLTEELGFKKENLDTIYCFYEICFFLLSGIDMRCYSFLKNDEIREHLFIYLTDKLFGDLDIQAAKEKNIVAGAMNVRLEEYSNLLKKSNTAEELNKSIFLLLIKKLTHSLIKKGFLNEPSAGLFPLQEGIVTSIYANSALLYIKRFNSFLDDIFKTGERFITLDENEIFEIKSKADNEQNQ